MDEDSTWSAIKNFALVCAPQWYSDMLVGRAIRLRPIDVKVTPPPGSSEIDILTWAMNKD